MAVRQVMEGMIVGLGSGSTAALAVEAIGRRVSEGLRIVGVPTSERTAAQARALGIPLSTLDRHHRLDLTIDGADEVEIPGLHLIKGRGGALLREKLVASASARLVIIVDSTKVVPRLGVADPVPVEVVPFGWQSTAERLERLGAIPKLRLGSDSQAVLTDGGHYILDCDFGPIASVPELAEALDRVVGVVEHGLFVGLASEVIVGGAEGATVLRPPNQSHSK